MGNQPNEETLLGNYRVLDLTDDKGYYCGKILGDLGADVIKIERPEGDPGRNIGPFYKDTIDPEKSLFWMYFNTSKRGITLDIEKPAGQSIFKKLLQTADFLIESFYPGYMDNLGFNYDVLSKVNPRMIMVSISPFGQTGPYKDFRSSDIVPWAMGSTMPNTGRPETPVRIGSPQACMVGGSQAAAGAMIAHYHREMTGEGQHVDVSMQEAGIATMFPAVETWHLMKQITPRSETGAYFGRSGKRGFLESRYIWPCKDGYVCMYLLGGANIGMRNSSTELVKWAVSEGMALELKDYDWSQYNSSTITQEERDRLNEAIIPFLQTKTKEELYQAAREKGILLSPCNNMKDVLESPQLEARNFWSEIEHPELNEKITYPSLFLQLSECPVSLSRRAPLIGEHNEEVYGQELGLSSEEFTNLKNKRII